MEFNLENKRAKNRCETILEDALYLFLKKGYANTSLNDIVEKAVAHLLPFINILKIRKVFLKQLF